MIAKMFVFLKHTGWTIADFFRSRGESLGAPFRAKGSIVSTLQLGPICEPSLPWVSDALKVCLSALSLVDQPTVISLRRCFMKDPDNSEQFLAGAWDALHVVVRSMMPNLLRLALYLPNAWRHLTGRLPSPNQRRSFTRLLGCIACFLFDVLKPALDHSHFVSLHEDDVAVRRYFGHHVDVSSQPVCRNEKMAVVSVVSGCSCFSGRDPAITVQKDEFIAIGTDQVSYLVG